MPTKIEFKAYCKSKDKIRELLLSIGAKSNGTDRQIDTHFHSKSGILKLREGSIENNLIHYIKEEKKGAHKIHVSTYPTTANSGLKQILEKSIGTTCIVHKTREIYHIDNVKFHIDMVDGLGDFIEIEAEDTDGGIPIEKLKEQCNYYIKTLEINAKDLLSESYSDLLQRNNLFSQILVDE